MHLTTSTLPVSDQDFKLQFADKGVEANCSDVAGGSYADVTTDTAISYYDNTAWDNGTTTGATSSEGDQLEYIFMYRGPSNINSGDYMTSLTHTQVFSTPGEYYVYITARCVEHTDAKSNPYYSEKFYFTITE